MKAQKCAPRTVTCTAVKRGLLSACLSQELRRILNPPPKKTEKIGQFNEEKTIQDHSFKVFFLKKNLN